MDHLQLRDAVAGGAVAIRVRQRLQPADGPGGKVFPPTYGVDRGGLKYAKEDRLVDGQPVPVVLLDSVASQANRLELALLDAWEEGRLELPVPYTDFSSEDGLRDLARITALEAPHRVADAIFRDSLLDGTLFRLSDIGRAITEASPRDATALFTYSPTALLFGMWDSTGPKGGLGSKFQRAIVSEIVAIDAHPGVKVGSRIDPLAIERDAATVLTAADPDEGWTLDPEAAAQDKGKPKPFDRGGVTGSPGTPSKVNHGNVTPSIDSDAGGVTCAFALQTAVLSLAALRKVRFVHDSDGNVLPTGTRRDAETEARTVIAALGLAAIVYQHEQDFDLRSRCLLIPEGPQSVELIRRDASEPEPLVLDQAGVEALVGDAVAAAAGHGLRWHGEDLRLVPAPKLAELVRRSRKLTAEEAVT